ncbi:hypothetical protein K0M31_017979 [Melipona bicolor]|uniref:Uncharacterized protein n=1 Tax=Melipona bicolor TaxID=60889 RepID=A0AA40FDC1_9HYME|nr:hypothetical protein K0M31_017979 [Melipona bicolor]
MIKRFLHQQKYEESSQSVYCKPPTVEVYRQSPILPSRLATERRTRLSTETAVGKYAKRSNGPTLLLSPSVGLTESQGAGRKHTFLRWVRMWVLVIRLTGAEDGSILKRD